MAVETLALLSPLDMGWKEDPPTIDRQGSIAFNGEQPVVLSFHPSNQQTAYFDILIPDHYEAANDLEIIIPYATTSSSGNVRVELAMEGHVDQTTDIDTDSFTVDTATSISGTSSTGNTVRWTRQTSSMNGEIAPGRSARLRVRRLAADAADTNAGSWQVLGLQLSSR